MKYWFALASLCFLLTSCMDNPSTEGKTKKSENKKKEKQEIKEGGRRIINAGSSNQYVGKPGRLLIVTESSEYTDEIANVFDSIFGAPIRPYYPRTPYFDIYQRTPKDFKRLSTRLRNVIDLAIDKNVEKGKPTMHVYENYYAEKQLYTKLRAHDIIDLYDIVTKQVDYLFKLYDRQEWKREYLRYAENKNKDVRSRLKKKFGIDLVLPKKYKYESKDNSYAIIRFPDRSRQMDLKMGSGNMTSKVNFSQGGIIIWQYPFKDSSQLDPKELIRMRDTILKKYAKYDMEGVYMGTQYHPAALPVHEKLRIGDNIGYQFRGLYKFTGAAEPSGGRFWGFQFKHPTRNTIVAVSGYFHVPPTISAKFEINRIRAILYSMKTVE